MAQWQVLNKTQNLKGDEKQKWSWLSLSFFFCFKVCNCQRELCLSSQFTDETFKRWHLYRRHWLVNMNFSTFLRRYYLKGRVAEKGIDGEDFPSARSLCRWPQWLAGARPGRSQEPRGSNAEGDGGHRLQWKGDLKEVVFLPDCYGS